MKRIALALSVLLLGASCIGEARAGTPALTLSQQVSARLGVEVTVPQALAGMSAAEVVGIAANLPTGVPLDMVTMVPGVGPGYVDSFSVSCTSAAAVKIQPAGGAMISYVCQNAATTLVHVGDSTISDPGTTRDAPIYCLTNCPAQEFGGNARAEYCRGDTDTTIYCRALVSVTSAP